jgi:hypothetical protein
MRLFTCARENEVSEALHRGHWPDGCATELRNHVVACRTCSDLVFVSQALQSARAQAIAMPHLEVPGVLWWRAQLRRRNAALEQIDKPILGAQLFAFAVILAVGALALAWQVRQGHGLTAWLKDLTGVLHFESLLPASFAHSDSGLWVLVPALATIALLSGVVVYLASEKQ